MYRCIVFSKMQPVNTPESDALITSARVPVLGRMASVVNYGDFNRQADALAAALVQLGLKKGDRVALVLPNTVAFCIGYFAVLKAGGVVAATNPTYPAGKMAYQINDCDAEIVITLTLFYDTIKSIQSQTKVKTIIVGNIKEYLPGVARVLFSIAREKKDGHYVEALQPGDHWLQDLLKKYDGQTSSVQVSADDMALYQYTGGTTGVSKAAMARHSALVANMLQIDTMIRAAGIAREDQIYLGAIPLFHVYGIVTVLSSGVYQGARILLVPNARDIDDVVDVIDSYKPTVFNGVPALYNAISNNAKVTSGAADLRSVRLCISGSAPLPRTVQDEFEHLSDSVVREGFGMSEMPTATHCNLPWMDNRTGSIGVPLPDIECRIVSLDDGLTAVEAGEIGELIMRGPNMMEGYHGMPTETANALREIDGVKWLFTGDIARMDDDGFFYIVDRKKDMALIGGYNVYPAAIENAIKMHPGVLEVGVAAIPHPEKEGQEALKAWVVTKPGETIASDEMISFLDDKLAQYEIPRRIDFIAELPKSAVGKTLRRELIRMETEGVGAVQDA